MEIEIIYFNETKEYYKNISSIELCNNWIHINGEFNLIIQISEIKKFLIVKGDKQ